MKIREDIAHAHFESGHNCAQAVAVAFHDLVGLDEDTVLRMASSFGGGIGKLREVCGAVSGMALITGLLYGYTDPDDKCAKDAHYELVQQLAQAFKDRHGSLICRELLEPPQSGALSQPDDEWRPCPDLVISAAQILDALIASRSQE